MPKSARRTTARFRIMSALTPNIEMIVESRSVAKVKLTTSPMTTPLTQRLLPSIPLAKITGKIGNTHGENTVKSPDIHAIGNNINILFLLIVNHN